MGEGEGEPSSLGNGRYPYGIIMITNTCDVKVNTELSEVYSSYNKGQINTSTKIEFANIEKS